MLDIKIGTQINYLTVLRDKEMINDIYYHWCKCKCGKERYVHRSTLLSQSIQDCGCHSFVWDNYIGKKYGRLTVLRVYSEGVGKNTTTYCVCKCDCGNETTVNLQNLKRGASQSCGCIKRFDFEQFKKKKFEQFDVVSLINKKKKTVLCKCNCGNFFTCFAYDLTSKKPIKNCGHCGKQIAYPIKAFRERKHTRIEQIYWNMIQRCYNKNNPNYKNYGGRGIKICDEWRSSIHCFQDWAFSHGYNENLTIERIDVNGNYCQENCTWIPRSEQQKNKRAIKKYEYNGKLLCLSDIASESGVKYSMLQQRIKRGMSLENALTQPSRRRKA